MMFCVTHTLLLWRTYLKAYDIQKQDKVVYHKYIFHKTYLKELSLPD